MTATDATTPAILTAPTRDVGDNILDPDGRPRTGVFRGTPEVIDYRGLAEPYARGRIGTFLRHKQWMYVFVATDEVIITTAIADAGPSGTGFLMVTDRATGELLADVSRPGGAGPLVTINRNPTTGHRARYIAPGTFMTMQGDEVELRIRTTFHRLRSLPVLSDPWIEMDVRLGIDVHPGMTTVAEIQGFDLITATAKNAALPTRGQLTIRNEGRTAEYDLSSGYGGFDYTSGYLPRRTSWRWAFTTGSLEDGRSLGLNLVSGFTGLANHAEENAAWLSGRAYALPRTISIQYDEHDPTGPWLVESPDGAVDLEFTPLAVHRESLNLGLLRSRFVQPTGHFSGTVQIGAERVTLDAMPGVVENQDVLW